MIPRFVVVLSILFLISGCAGGQQLACPADAKLCPDGTSVGRSGPTCTFSPCPALKGVACTPEQSKADYCIEMFDPVCGNDGKTYGNSCFACQAGVRTWMKGSCPKK